MNPSPTQQTFNQIVKRLKDFQIGDLLMPQDFYLIGTALELIKLDLIDNGVVCDYCDSIIPRGSASCVKCGSPAGRAHRHTITNTNLQGL